MSVINYDAAKVVVTIGITPIGGWADGDFLTVSKPDSWTDQTGADGERARSKQNMPGGTITIKTMAGALVNDLLQGYWIADETTGAGVFPISITDLSGKFAAFSGDAWITKVPDGAFGKDNGEVEWVIACGHLTMGHAAAARAGA